MAVVAGSLLPDSSVPMRILSRLHISDKILHFSGYTLLAMLPAIHERLRAIAWASFGLIALGIFIELAQFASGWGRMFEFRDVAANTLGIGVGVVSGLFVGSTALRCGVARSRSRRDGTWARDYDLHKPGSLAPGDMSRSNRRGWLHRDGRGEGGGSPASAA
jgi:hypothetical protein